MRRGEDKDEDPIPSVLQNVVLKSILSSDIMALEEPEGGIVFSNDDGTYSTLWSGPINTCCSGSAGVRV